MILDELKNADIGTILYHNDPNFDYYGVALKVTTLEWCLTGYDKVYRSEALLNMTETWKFACKIYDNGG